MRKLALAMLLLLPTVVFAQDKEYTLRVNSSELNLIGNGLEGLPYKDVSKLMGKLQMQVAAQNTEPAPASSATPPKPSDQPKPNDNAKSAK